MMLECIYVSDDTVAIQPPMISEFGRLRPTFQTLTSNWRHALVTFLLHVST